MRDIRSLPIALAALLLTAGAALAAPGLAITDVNVRQGPGMNFPVVATIPGAATSTYGCATPDVAPCASVRTRAS